MVGAIPRLWLIVRQQGFYVVVTERRSHRPLYLLISNLLELIITAHNDCSSFIC